MFFFFMPRWCKMLSLYFMYIVVQPTGFSLRCRPRGRMPSICKQRKDKFWAKGSSRSMKRSTWLNLYILKRSWKAKPPLNTSEYWFSETSRSHSLTGFIRHCGLPSLQTWLYVQLYRPKKNEHPNAALIARWKYIRSSNILPWWCSGDPLTSSRPWGLRWSCRASSNLPQQMLKPHT